MTISVQLYDSAFNYRIVHLAFGFTYLHIGVYHYLSISRSCVLLLGLPFVLGSTTVAYCSLGTVQYTYKL